MKMTPQQTKKLFEKVIPEERLTIDEDTLDRYSRDQAECEPGRPDLVAFVKTDTEMVEIVKIASKYRIPLVPRVA
jgi:FAD/FMN-containing dehydrogenase